MMEIALALSLQQDQRLAGDDQAVGNQNAGGNAQVLDGNVILPDNNDDDDDDEDDDDEAVSYTHLTLPTIYSV